MGALTALEAHWETLRAGPTKLTHKDAVALAGEVRADFISAFDEEPGTANIWTGVAIADARARAGRLHPLRVGTEQTKTADLEVRYGGFADVALERRGLVVDQHDRANLVKQLSVAMLDVPLINRAKALGDYSDSGETNRFPPYVLKQAKPVPVVETGGMTFEAVINAEVSRRSVGKDAKPIPDRTITKFRRAAEEFAKARKCKRVETVTARQADEWKMAMLETGKLTNSTIAQRLQNLRTIIGWARKQSLGELFPDRNPLDLVERPQRNGVKSEDRTLRMSEAKAILIGARQEVKPELRWLPWMCAYSGARIEELAQLTAGDFFEYEGDAFFKVTTKGGKSLKNVHSVRRVPVHPDLIEEGILKFIESQRKHPNQRLFSNRSQGNVASWVRNTIGLTRKDMAPSHGWRHLFEDVAMSAGMQDSAKTYITGRASGRSADSYGKSDVMLPGLAKEMRKLQSYF